MSGKDSFLGEERNQSIKQVIRTAQRKCIEGNTQAFFQREPEVAIFKMVPNSGVETNELWRSGSWQGLVG